MALLGMKSVSSSVRELEIRKKTPILKGFIVALMVLVAVLAISDFITGDVLFGIVECGCVGIFAATFLLLRKGRYVLASYLAAVLTWLAVAFIGFSGEAGPTMSVYKITVYLMAASAFAAFFLLELAVPMAMSAVNLVLIASYYVLRVKAPLLGGASGNVFIVALFFAALLQFVTIQLARLGRTVGEDLDREKLKGDSRLAAMREAVEKSESNLRSLGSLVQRVDDIRSVAKAISEASAAISTELAELDRAADEATGEAESIGERMRELNGHIESESAAQVESAASVNEMVASIGSVAESVRKRREGMSAIIGTADEGEARLNELLAAIARVEGSVGDVSQMAGAIKKIASSTNLLAMNASIEAAHAGDAGRGFSVVAEEIRSLAENAARNAKDIGQKLKDVVSAITQAASQSDPMKSAFAKIRAGMDEAILSFDEIKSATGELSEGGRQILESIKLLNEASAGVRDGGSAILGAQSRLIAIQGRTKEAVKSVAGEVASVAERDQGLLDSAAAVSGVVAENAKTAEELHAAMLQAEKAS